jgi:F-type H+-transporting ATPase subunit b
MSLFAVSTNDLFKNVLSFGVTNVSGSSEGAVNVDADATIVVHVVLFLVALFALKPLLFDPLLKLFEEREKRTIGTKEAARKEDEKSAKAKASYEAEMAKARSEGNAEREKLRAEGLKKEADILAKVRAEAAATLEQGRARVSGEAAAAQKALEIESAALGRDLASRVLGREVRG